MCDSLEIRLRMTLVSVVLSRTGRRRRFEARASSSALRPRLACCGPFYYFRESGTAFGELTWVAGTHEGIQALYVILRDNVFNASQGMLSLARHVRRDYVV